MKYSVEEDGSVTIIDHDGKEITVEELVNRYYDNPNDYFDFGDNKLTNVCKVNNDKCESSMYNSDDSQMDLVFRL